MKFSVLERLVLLNVLPREGDFTTLKILRKLREDLSFNEDEHKAFGLTAEFVCPDCGQESAAPAGTTPEPCQECDRPLKATGSLKWDRSVPQDAELDIGEKAMDILVARLKELNRQKKLREEHMGVYERLVASD